MPRRKDAMLHAEQATAQVLNAYRIIYAQYLDASSQANESRARSDELSEKLHALRSAAEALGVPVSELNNLDK